MWTLSGVNASAPYCFDIVENAPPFAYFEALTKNGAPGQGISFDSCPGPIPRCSYDPDTGIAKYVWDFGDGYTSETQAPFHVYALPGSYDVQLTVIDEYDATSTFMRTIDVGWVDAPPAEPGEPAADAGPDRTVLEGEVVQLSGSASGFPEGTPDAPVGEMTLSWKLARGPLTMLTGADSATPSFTAPMLASGQPVDLMFSLEATQDGTTTAPDFAIVHVVSVNHAPVADAGESRPVYAGMVVTLDASGSTDEDGAAGLDYEWEQVSGVPTVELTGADTSAATFTAPAGTGALEFRLRVSDGKASSLDEVKLILNPRQAQAPARFTYTVTRTDAGADVDFQATGTSLATWEFDDGTTDEGGAVTHAFAPGTYVVTMRSGQGDEAQAYSQEVVVTSLGSEQAAVGAAWLPIALIGVAFLAAALACVHFVRKRQG
jgi:PKD repeat protein